MRRIHIIYLITYFIISTSCNNKAKNYIQSNGYVFGTVYNITYQNPKNESLKIGIDSVLNKVNLSLSPFKKESIISKINNNDSVELDNYISIVLNKSVEISEKTNGNFDITVAPLVNIWGFGFGHKESVTPQLIDSVKQFIGYKNFEIINNRVEKKDYRTMLDCSAIAKGFAVDMVGEYLAKEGCINYMVEIGGEIIAKGVNEDGISWRVGISTPKEGNLNNNDIYDIVSLNNKAMATSGNYRNFYIEDGKKYAHTISPKTGYPVQHTLLSATILAQNCMQADAYATACMVIGLEKSIEIINNTPDMEGYFIYSGLNGEYLKKYTSGFFNIIEK